MPYFWETSSIKVEYRFDHILIVLFEIHCGDVDRQNDINCVTVKIHPIIWCAVYLISIAAITILPDQSAVLNVYVTF